LASENVSQPKDEKVVKPPRTPTSNPMRYSARIG
jgi:hypothetical protein